MTERELSEKLSELAGRIESNLENLEGRPPAAIWEHLLNVAKELRSLSNEKYTPGSVTWDDVKKTTLNQPNTRRFPF